MPLMRIYLLVLVLIIPCFLTSVFLSFTGISFMSGGSEIETSLTSPQVMFENLIEKPVPSHIRNLEGGGYTWQGYSVYLRFIANDGFVKKLQDEGYVEEPWEKMKFETELPDALRTKFSVPWTPAEVKKKRCFRKAIKNDWTHDGMHYFLFDEDTKTVYFYGIGA